jgi:uncharacterized membrane protein
MTIGPIQICIVGFRGTAFSTEILAELKRLGDDVIRIVDVVGVVKTADGDIRAIGDDGPGGDTAELGPVIGALLGLQEERSTTNGAAPAGVAGTSEHPGSDDAPVFNLADELRTGEAAAIAVIEHRWMARIEDAVARLNGTFLLDAYVNSDDLMGLGSRVARALEGGKQP